MQVKTVIYVEGLANLVMMATKLAVGLSTNSMAIIGDAFHSLTDLSNNVIALIALRISAKPKDHDHHYGHRKFEQLAVFGLAVLLAVVAVELLINAIGNAGKPVMQSGLGLVMMLFALVINICLAWWERYWAKRLDSDLLEADAKHTLSDVLTTVAVIIGWQGAALGYFYLDTFFALVVAAIILYMAVTLFQRAVPVLVDQNIHNSEEMERVVTGIDKVEAVRQVRARHSRDGGLADIVISVDANMTTMESHAVTEAIEQALRERFGIKDIVIHVEPH